jgi:catechol 2,3-dioxygenase-like lactoylglutathione lyase family enzyme
VSIESSKPAVWVGHVVLETSSMDASAEFMKTIGMRTIFHGPQVSVFELRGGTHLILMAKPDAKPGDATFDLMVDDLRATHARFTSLGFEPGDIEAMPAIDHERFYVREPGGHRITFFSSHVSGKPV